MRKFLFCILAALLSVGSGWAQTDVIEVSTNVRSPENLYLGVDGPNNRGYYWSSLGAPVKVNDAAVFAFFRGSSDNCYYIYCVTTGAYLSYSTDALSDGKNKVISTTIKNEAKQWQITTCRYGGTQYYQIQPFGANGNVVEQYMNWYTGVGNNNTHNSILF